MTKALFGLPEQVVFVNVVLSQISAQILLSNLKMSKMKKKLL